MDVGFITLCPKFEFLFLTTNKALCNYMQYLPKSSTFLWHYLKSKNMFFKMILNGLQEKPVSLSSG